MTSGGAGEHALKRTLAGRFGIADDLRDLEIAGMTDSGIVVSILKKHRIAETKRNIATFLDGYAHFLSLECRAARGDCCPG